MTAMVGRNIRKVAVKRNMKVQTSGKKFSKEYLDFWSPEKPIPNVACDCNFQIASQIHMQLYRAISLVPLHAIPLINQKKQLQPHCQTVAKWLTEGAE